MSAWVLAGPAHSPEAKSQDSVSKKRLRDEHIVQKDTTAPTSGRATRWYYPSWPSAAENLMARAESRSVWSAWSLLPLSNVVGHRKREQAPRTLPQSGTSRGSVAPLCEPKLVVDQWRVSIRDPPH